MEGSGPVHQVERPASPELVLGRPQSPETREKIRQSRTGSQHTQATRDKISRSLQGYHKDQEHKDEISRSMRGTRNRQGLPRRSQPLAVEELLEQYSDDPATLAWIKAHLSELQDLSPEEPYNPPPSPPNPDPDLI